MFHREDGSAPVEPAVAALEAGTLRPTTFEGPSPLILVLSRFARGDISGG